MNTVDNEISIAPRRCPRRSRSRARTQIQSRTALTRSRSDLSTRVEENQTNSTTRFRNRIFPLNESNVPLTTQQLILQNYLVETLFRTNKATSKWSWMGESVQLPVHVNNHKKLKYRKCYSCINHTEGIVIRVHDYVLLKPTKCDEKSYIAKVLNFWESPCDEEKMMSLIWYYRPEQTSEGRQPNDELYEIFSSNHYDNASVDCIEEKCNIIALKQTDSYWTPILDTYYDNDFHSDVVFYTRYHYDYKNRVVIRDNETMND